MPKHHPQIKTKTRIDPKGRCRHDNTYRLFHDKTGQGSKRDKGNQCIRAVRDMIVFQEFEAYFLPAYVISVHKLDI
jgi:hypothetical protein